jgi:hypothetical protein
MSLKTKLATLSLVIVLWPTVFHADGTQFTFKLVSSEYNTAILEPVLPVQIKMTKLEGDNPATTFIQCTIAERKDVEITQHVLKCGTAIYQISGVLFSH